MNDTQQQRPQSQSSADFQEAVERLERAVHELVNAKKDEFSEKATAFIDETTERLQREFRAATGAGTATTARRRRHENAGGRRAYDRRVPRRREPSRGKIAGVCARIADRYGMEPWVVRLLAVTGLLFLPSIVFPAYWILWFLMRRSPESERGRPQPRQPDHSSPAPELGPRLSPRNSLRNVQDSLAEAELKLRRMESHVTSGQFELQRELRKIDR